MVTRNPVRRSFPYAAERRVADRRRVAFDVVWGQEQWQVRARATDLSATGIQVQRPSLVPEEQAPLIPMLLHVPGRGRPFTVSAVPIWTEGTRAGFAFALVDPAEQLELAELIDNADLDSERSTRRLAAMAQYCAALAEDDGE